MKLTIQEGILLFLHAPLIRVESEKEFYLKSNTIFFISLL